MLYIGINDRRYGEVPEPSDYSAAGPVTDMIQQLDVTPRYAIRLRNLTQCSIPRDLSRCFKGELRAFTSCRPLRFAVEPACFVAELHVLPSRVLCVEEHAPE